MDVFEKAQRHSGQIAPAPLQDALAEFIDHGHFAAHIRKMTRIYRGRRDRLVQALGAAGGDALKMTPPAGGMQLLVELDRRQNDVAIAKRLAGLGVMTRPLSGHFTGEIAAQGLFLGFAAWTEREIDAGADIIGRVVRRLAGFGLKDRSAGRAASLGRVRRDSVNTPGRCRTCRRARG